MGGKPQPISPLIPPAPPPLPLLTEEMIRAGLMGGLTPRGRRRRAIWGREFEAPVEWEAVWRTPVGYRLPAVPPVGVDVLYPRTPYGRPVYRGLREAGRFIMPELHQEVIRRMARIISPQLGGYPLEALLKYHRDILGEV